MSNMEFARRVGCNHSMASRIRAGKRLPGFDALQRIHEEFGISMQRLFDARRAGPEEFAKLMRSEVFDSPAHL